MAKRKRKAESFSDALRRLIAESGRSRNSICRAADIDPSHLHRFVYGDAKLTNETIDRLTATLGLRLTADNER